MLCQHLSRGCGDSQHPGLSFLRIRHLNTRHAAVRSVGYGFRSSLRSRNPRLAPELPDPLWQSHVEWWPHNLPAPTPWCRKFSPVLVIDPTSSFWINHAGHPFCGVFATYRRSTEPRFSCVKEVLTTVACLSAENLLFYPPKVGSLLSRKQAPITNCALNTAVHQQGFPTFHAFVHL